MYFYSFKKNLTKNSCNFRHNFVCIFNQKHIVALIDILFVKLFSGLVLDRQEKEMNAQKHCKNLRASVLHFITLLSKTRKDILFYLYIL